MELLRYRISHREWIVSAVLLIVLTSLILAGCGSDSPGKLNGITREPPASTGKLTLPDESPAASGRETLVRGPEGGLLLVYFGYTFCPDVCPTSMADLRLALAELDPDQRERVRVAMITVDPERDTGRVLNNYLGHFFEEGEFHSLRTSDPDRLTRVEKAFGASHKLGQPDEDGNYDVDHTAQIFAVNDRGTVLVEWPFMTKPDLIAEDLKSLLDSESPDA